MAIKTLTAKWMEERKVLGVVKNIQHFEDATGRRNVRVTFSIVNPKAKLEVDGDWFPPERAKELIARIRSGEAVGQNVFMLVIPSMYAALVEPGSIFIVSRLQGGDYVLEDVEKPVHPSGRPVYDVSWEHVREYMIKQ